MIERIVVIKFAFSIYYFLSNRKFNNLIACFRLDASLRNIAYMVATKYGNETELAFMINKFHEEEHYVERDRIFSALASSSNHSYIAT